MRRTETDQQQSVEKAGAMLVEALDGMRTLPSYQTASAAREAISDLRPHLEAAVAALETIEERRDLTERERDLQHAFKMLLDSRRLLE